MKLAPIGLFTYNRLDHTRQTVEALQKNDLAAKSELFIYSDGAKNSAGAESVQAVREYLKTISGFKNVEIIERDTNWGLADSIVDGVTNVVNKFGKVIVLEDDILTSPYFLQYMNNALDLYERDENVMHINGYSYPINTTDLPSTFFANPVSCWGWATWDDAWSALETDATTLLQKLTEKKKLRELDLDGSFRFSSTLRANIKGTQRTWAIKWYSSVLLRNGLALYPNKSLTQNIGQDGTGTHTGVGKTFTAELESNTKLKLSKNEFAVHNKAQSRINHYFMEQKPSLFTRIINFVFTNRGIMLNDMGVTKK